MYQSVRSRLAKSRPRLLIFVLMGGVAFLSLVGMYVLRDNRALQSWQLVLAGVDLLLVVTGLVLLWNWSRRLEAERRQLDMKYKESLRAAELAAQRLNAVIRISRQFVETTDENEIIELALQSAIELTQANGASFVPLDERGHPMGIVMRSEQPFPVPDVWVEYLATPAVRDRCRACNKELPLTATCPLLAGPFANARDIYCLPLKRGERDLGVFNLYIPDAPHLDTDTRDFLRSLMDETALALESARLRDRELVALSQLQAVRQKTDLGSQVASLLENLRQTLEAEFALLVLPEALQQAFNPDQSAKDPANGYFNCGEAPVQARPVIIGILQGVLSANEPVILGSIRAEASDKAKAELWSLLAAPIPSSTQTALGVLAVGSRYTNAFNKRSLSLLQTVAAQAGLTLQSSRQMADLGFKVMMEERTRLAREIHDGLAQTLGFLKLQMAQINMYLERGELDRLRPMVKSSYQALSDAYQEARFAIDGLRISPSGSDLAALLAQIVSDYQESITPGQLTVHLGEVDVRAELPSEVLAQLVRIVQESLSNARKHSQANNVWVSCCEGLTGIELTIQDDGIGFSPEDVSSPSRHGLQGMRERADLIGADFQITSASEQGTIIRVSIPVGEGEKQ